MEYSDEKNSHSVNKSLLIEESGENKHEHDECVEIQKDCTENEKQISFNSSIQMTSNKQKRRAEPETVKEMKRKRCTNEIQNDKCIPTNVETNSKIQNTITNDEEFSIKNVTLSDTIKRTVLLNDSTKSQVVYHSSFKKEVTELTHKNNASACVNQKTLGTIAKTIFHDITDNYQTQDKNHPISGQDTTNQDSSAQELTCRPTNDHFVNKTFPSAGTEFDLEPINCHENRHSTETFKKTEHIQTQNEILILPTKQDFPNLFHQSENFSITDKELFSDGETIVKISKNHTSPLDDMMLENSCKQYALNTEPFRKTSAINSRTKNVDLRIQISNKYDTQSSNNIEFQNTINPKSEFLDKAKDTTAKSPSNKLIEPPQNTCMKWSQNSPEINHPSADEAKSQTTISSDNEETKEIEFAYNTRIERKQNSPEIEQSLNLPYFIDNGNCTPPSTADSKSISHLPIKKRIKYRRRISRDLYNASINLESTPKFKSKVPTFETDEFIPDVLQVSDEFLQTQYQILESISQQRHADKNISSEDNYKDEKLVPEKENIMNNIVDEYQNEIDKCLVLQAALKLFLNKNNKLTETVEDLKSKQNLGYAETSMSRAAENKNNNPESQELKYAAELENKFGEIIKDFRNEIEKSENSQDKRSFNEHLGLAEIRSKVVQDFLKSTKKRKFRKLSKDETFDNGKTLQQMLDKFNAEYHEMGESSKREEPKIEYPAFREYPGLAEDPTTVKKDARFQKRFYKQNPVILPTNWKADVDSNYEPEVIADELDDPVEIIGEYPPILTQENDPLSFSSHKMKRKKTLRNESRLTQQAASETSAHVGERYNVSSFIEESPSHSNPNSLDGSVLSDLAQDTENWVIKHTKISSSVEHKTSFSKNILQQKFPEVIHWVTVTYNCEKISDERAIYARNIENEIPSTNFRNPSIPLRSFLIIVDYLTDRNDRKEYSLEEFLNMLFCFRAEFTEWFYTFKSQLDDVTMEIPLFKIPISVNSSLIYDDDYELVGDILVQVNRNSMDLEHKSYLSEINTENLSTASDSGLSVSTDNSECDNLVENKLVNKYSQELAPNSESNQTSKIDIENLFKMSESKEKIDKSPENCQDINELEKVVSKNELAVPRRFRISDSPNQNKNHTLHILIETDSHSSLTSSKFSSDESENVKEIPDKNTGVRILQDDHNQSQPLDTDKQSSKSPS